MKCNEFTREQLTLYANHWSYELEEGLWHKIWEHSRDCPSCNAVIMQVYSDNRKEMETAKERFPNLVKKILEYPWLNHIEMLFKDRRKRKLELRKSQTKPKN